MEKNAAVLNVRSLTRMASLLSLAVAAILLLGPSAAAEARPIGKDGKIHACYRVKGKPKGALRVVRSKRARCRRGERKMSWSVAASPGAAGSTGQQGSGGEDGAVGSAGSNETLLKEQIGALSQRVVTLEAILSGVTNEGLTSAIGAVPAVESLCTQASTVTTGLNALRTGILGLSILGDVTGLLDLDTSGLPAALPPFTCPAP